MRPLARPASLSREAASALEGRGHRSPGQATPKAERRPGYSAICVRFPRPLWPQSAKLTGAKEAMELTCVSGVEVGGMSGIQYQRSSRVPSRVRLPTVVRASRPLRQDGTLNRPRHPRRPYPTRLPRRTSRAHSGWKPLLLWARYDSAAAKVGGNQGRMAGRRRAVGFLQIVPAKRRGVH